MGSLDLELNLLYVAWFSWLCSFFAPVENPGKPLFERVRIVNKRKTLIITLMVIIISLSIRIKLPDASFAILVVLIEVALLIIWGKEDVR